MDKVIIVNNGDSTVGIIYPAREMFDPNSRTRLNLADKGITFNNEQEVYDWIIAKDVPAGKSYRITDVSNIPQDRAFRDAWTDDNQTETVDVNMSKARDIHRSLLRNILRKKKLAVLDALYFRADEAGDSAKKSEIAALKQQLRDMPQTFDLSVAETPEQLKEMIPDYLS